MAVNLNNDECYIGQWKHGKKHGHGMGFDGEGNFYIGEWEDGKPSGYGIMSYPDGTVYLGGFREDVRNGKGYFYESNGNSYEGEFLNGFRHGEGILYIPEDGFYKINYSHQGVELNRKKIQNSGLHGPMELVKKTTEYVDEAGKVYKIYHGYVVEKYNQTSEKLELIPIGQGTMYFGIRTNRDAKNISKQVPSLEEKFYYGYSITGIWEGNQISGDMRVEFCNGDWYQQNKELGRGTYKMEHQETEQEETMNIEIEPYQLSIGTFNNQGELEGIGICLKQEECYMGGLKKGKPQGYGTKYEKNGTFYSGNWRDGLHSGKGIMLYRSGVVNEGEFLNDFWDETGTGIIYYMNGNSLKKTRINGKELPQNLSSSNTASTSKKEINNKSSESSTNSRKKMSAGVDETTNTSSQSTSTQAIVDKPSLTIHQNSSGTMMGGKPLSSPPSIISPHAAGFNTKRKDDMHLTETVMWDYENRKMLGGRRVTINPPLQPGSSSNTTRMMTLPEQSSQLAPPANSQDTSEAIMGGKPLSSPPSIITPLAVAFNIKGEDDMHLTETVMWDYENRKMLGGRRVTIKPPLQPGSSSNTTRMTLPEQSSQLAPPVNSQDASGTMMGGASVPQGRPFRPYHPNPNLHVGSNSIRMTNIGGRLFPGNSQDPSGTMMGGGPVNTAENSRLPTHPPDHLLDSYKRIIGNGWNQLPPQPGSFLSNIRSKQVTNPPQTTSQSNAGSSSNMPSRAFTPPDGEEQPSGTVQDASFSTINPNTEHKNKR
jgi:hypothetical protein